MSGVDLDGATDPQGRRRCHRGVCRNSKAGLPGDLRVVEEIAQRGGTPLVVADGGPVLGVIHLKDIVKGGIKERFARTARGWASRP